MILCCGEALIDMLPRTTTLGEAAFAPYAGGALFNTAIALGRLGAPVGMFTGLSTDILGEILARTLTESHVDFSLAARSGRPTTIALVKLVDGHATYAFYDENTAGRLLAEEDLPALPASTQALFFGGISLVNDPAASTYEALQAREAPGRVTMIDPNIRPSFVTDAAAYRARIDRMIALADIVKVSDEDLRWILGDGAVPDLARALVARGPALVCVTEGARGASAHARGGAEVFVPAEKVTVADTVGAGDTFNAGVLAALHRAGLLTKAAVAALPEQAIRDALTLGVRAAAVTVSRPGANPPWGHEL
jgi:fructokinase